MSSAKINTNRSPSGPFLLFCLLAVTTVFWLGPSWAGAAPPVVLGGCGKYPLGGYLEVLFDPGRELTIEEVSSPAHAKRFEAVKADVPNLGLTSSAVWIRFTVKNPEPGTNLLLAYKYPVTDEVEFYTPKPDGGFTRLLAGDAVRSSVEVVPNQNFIFPLGAPAEGEAVYYLRIVTFASVTIPLTLWRPEAFYPEDRRIHTTYGLLFGVVLGFVVYFLALSLRLRHASCLWFALYLTVFGLLVAIRKGFFQEFIGPDLYQLNNPVHVITLSLLYFFGAKLLRAFLDVKAQSRIVDRMLQILQWMGFFTFPCSSCDCRD